MVGTGGLRETLLVDSLTGWVDKDYKMVLDMMTITPAIFAPACAAVRALKPYIPKKYPFLPYPTERALRATPLPRYHGKFPL